MWGTVSSASLATLRIRGSGLAPQLLATLAAASIAMAIATSARANVGESAAFALGPNTAAFRAGISVKFDPVAVEPEAARLRTKLDIANVAQARIALPPRASAINGIASMYNPNNGSDDSGGKRTASGEFYEAEAWAAAIQIELRGAFGGVRFGRHYRPAFALVTAGEKSAIVKINDVGPLLPGRVIDLTERTMRYFDASLTRGLLQQVKVTPLPGAHWRSGPLDGGPALPMAGEVLPLTIH